MLLSLEIVWLLSCVLFLKNVSSDLTKLGNSSATSAELSNISDSLPSVSSSGIPILPQNKQAPGNLKLPELKKNLVATTRGTFAARNKKKIHFTGKGYQGKKNESPPVLIQRPNVVKENPSLDVGPLIEVTVHEGGTARLPCTSQSLNDDDAARLVLWYKNDTTRPFLSYDGRTNKISNPDSKYDGKFTSNFVQWKANKLTESKTRIFLSNGGASLVIKDVKVSDQTEYRCKIHYSHSPSRANRLRLYVKNTIQELKLLDAEGRPIGDRVGPFSENKHLSLSCTTQFTEKLESLQWLLDGEPLASSWTRTEENLVLSQIELNLQHEHANAVLTCRLRAKNQSGDVSTSIKDASTTVLMFYLPQATLIIDSAASRGLKTAEGPQGGVLYGVTEGMTVTFICAVKARPPPYHIAWLHNGRMIGSGSRRWSKHNSSLVVSPVNKDDTGLYTCIASNKEGDGNSNAINLKVSHAPYCAGPSRRQIVVIKNSSISLICEVEAEPSDVSFTWTFDPSSRRHTPGPNMQVYAPNSEAKNDKKKQNSASSHPNVPEPEIKTDPGNPRKSILTLTPENSVQGIVCFAKNVVGRMQVPCAFSLSFVDPPLPPRGCKVTVVSSSEISVSCQEENRSSNHLDNSPGISYVLSPEAKTLSHLEVWDEHQLLRNITGQNPTWNVESLPPNTKLLLRLYSTSTHSKSEPLVLYTRTKPNFYPIKSGGITSTSKTLHPDEEPNAVSVSEESVEPLKSRMGILNLILGLVAGVIVIMSFIILSIFFLKRRGRRRNNQQPPLIRAQIAIQETAEESGVIPSIRETVSQSALIEEAETST